MATQRRSALQRMDEPDYTQDYSEYQTEGERLAAEQTPYSDIPSEDEPVQRPPRARQILKEKLAGIQAGIGKMGERYRDYKQRKDDQRKVVLGREIELGELEAQRAELKARREAAQGGSTSSKVIGAISTIVHGTDEPDLLDRTRQQSQNIFMAGSHVYRRDKPIQFNPLLGASSQGGMAALSFKNTGAGFSSRNMLLPTSQQGREGGLIGGSPRFVGLQGGGGGQFMGIRGVRMGGNFAGFGRNLRPPAPSPATAPQSGSKRKRK